MRQFGTKMHQNAFGGRALPGPAGELQQSPDPLAAATGRGKEREIKRQKGKEYGKKGGRGKGRKGELPPPTKGG